MTTTKAKSNKGELGMEFIAICQRKAELNSRIAKAKAYSAMCENIRKENDRIRESKKSTKRNLILVTLAICAFLLCGYMEGKEADYAMSGVLQGNYVVLEDGNIHEVETRKADGEVTVYLQDNGTEDPTDDIVVEIR